MKKLSLSECHNVFMDRGVTKLLFPDQYFVFGTDWEPREVNENNLCAAALKTEVSASMEPEQQSYESVAFESTFLLNVSAARCDLFIYGARVTPEIVHQHTLFTLKSVVRKLSPLQIFFVLHYPLHVNSAELLVQIEKLGSVARSNAFDTDQAAMFSKEIVIKMKEKASLPLHSSHGCLQPKPK